MAYLAHFSHRCRGWCGLAATLLAGALAAAVVPAAAGREAADWLRIDRATAHALGMRIWRNEGRSDENYLLWWNEGEQFASLGIGHFIWYPAGETGRFHESFPALLSFLLEHGVHLPPWLAQAHHTGCPWPTRDEFLQARGSPRLVELRALLTATVDLQARFIVAGIEPAYHRILAHASDADAPALATRFRELARTDAGLYALVDYLHFKGDGTRPGERYAGEGWGLLQVLQEMGAPALRDVVPATAAYAWAARTVLERRVKNAPAARGEERWLPGWTRRVLGYHPPTLKKP